MYSPLPLAAAAPRIRSNLQHSKGLGDPIPHGLLALVSAASLARDEDNNMGRDVTSFRDLLTGPSPRPLRRPATGT
jgi:hypothetical protein